jgi:hypothetical protein
MKQMWNSVAPCSCALAHQLLREPPREACEQEAFANRFETQPWNQDTST